MAQVRVPSSDAAKAVHAMTMGGGMAAIVPARLSIVTLGVANVARSVAFYSALGWERCASSMEAIAWFRMTGSYLGIFGADALAEDAAVAPATSRAFGRITLAINVESEDAVAPALDAAVAAGGSLLKPATRADWGGLSGYFADPDGHPWEVAYNPGFPIDGQGRIHIP
jgi:catechol 2,3-dioxygenase-like lactoylglutathione lyase family enzyme